MIKKWIRNPIFGNTLTYFSMIKYINYNYILINKKNMKVLFEALFDLRQKK